MYSVTIIKSLKYFCELNNIQLTVYKYCQASSNESAFSGEKTHCNQRFHTRRFAAMLFCSTVNAIKINASNVQLQFICSISDK